jgi:hypothetical protein
LQPLCAIFRWSSDLSKAPWLLVCSPYRRCCEMHAVNYDNVEPGTIVPVLYHWLCIGQDKPSCTRHILCGD